MYFFIILVYWANFFSFRSKYIEQDCPNWNLRVHRKSWEKNMFFEKIVGVFIFFTIEQKSFKLLTKTFEQGCEYWFRCGDRMFLRSFVWHWANPFRHSVVDFPLGMSETRSKFLIFSWHWAKNFRPFVKKTEAGLPELLSTCLQEQFERFVFLKKVLNFFFLFRTLSANTLALCQYFSMGLSIEYSACP